MNNLKHYSIVTVVLSGGFGTRLWPESRKDHPKPFISITDNSTLAEKTYLRSKKISKEILTVTNSDYLYLTIAEMEKSAVIGTVVLEPFAKGTAPAIAYATKIIKDQRSDDPIIFVMSSDHVIEDDGLFEDTVNMACKAANDGYIVTIGVKPTRPESGYGYIECGDKLNNGYLVQSFIEKPEIEIANELILSNKFLWNAGIFCFKASVFEYEMLTYNNKMMNDIRSSIYSTTLLDEKYKIVRIDPDNYKSIDNESIDYALMEKSSRIAVIPTKMHWMDLGSWNSVFENAIPDSDGNVLSGDIVQIKTNNTFIKSGDRLVAAIGLDNLIIVDTRDALLVSHIDHAQDVKSVVSKLESIGHEAHKSNVTVTRPWGTYKVLEVADGYKIKKLVINPSASLSLQLHNKRSEHWIVVEGTASITNGTESYDVHVNESTYIPIGQMHRIQNFGKSPCVIIEVQCGSYLGEDDIVRFDDAYLR